MFVVRVALCPPLCLSPVRVPVSPALSPHSYIPALAWDPRDQTALPAGMDNGTAPLFALLRVRPLRALSVLGSRRERVNK